MLWILTGIGLILIGVGVIYLVNNKGNFAIRHIGIDWIGLGSIISFIFGMLLCITLQCRYSTIYNNSRQIEVLEENNRELLAELEPVIEKCLNYESGTLTKLKINPDTLIAYSVYPELKGNEFVMEQVKIIKNNNREIKDKKLELASLESYRIWLFMGE